MKFKNIFIGVLCALSLNVYATDSNWWQNLNNKDGKIYVDKTKKNNSFKPVVQTTSAYYAKKRVYLLSSQVWAVPANVTQIKVFIVGGGGGGGALAGYTGGNCAYGGGGGGAEIVSTSLDITGVTSITVNVGQGGIGGNSGVADCVGNGVNGQDSSIVYVQGGPTYTYTALGGGGGGGGGLCTQANKQKLPASGGGISEVAGVQSSDYQSQSKGAGGGASHTYFTGSQCDFSKDMGIAGIPIDSPHFNLAVGKGATFGGIGVTTTTGTYGISGSGGGGYGGTDAGMTITQNNWDCSTSGSIKSCKPSLLPGMGGQGYWGVGGKGGYGGFQLPDMGSTSQFAFSGSGYGAGGAGGGYGGGGGGGYLGDGNIPEVGGAQQKDYGPGLTGSPGIVIIEYVVPQ